MSETLVPELRSLVLGAGGMPRSVRRRPRRRTLRLKARIADQEQELFRRQNIALSLARDVRSLRAALESALADRRRLERELTQLRTLRAQETTAASGLAAAVTDQQSAIRELERALAAVLDGYRRV